MQRPDGERLAVIEAIALRIESKLDGHETRISKLERFRWYATGVFTVVVTAIITYFRSR